MRELRAVLQAVLMAGALAYSVLGPAAPAPDAPVLFVCEHGNVKSLMAATLFDAAASKRGLSVRSISRGLHPESGVPAPVAAALKHDGVDVGGFVPKALTRDDASAARRVIAIGVALPSFRPGADARSESWQDIPPASADYAAARAALARHIDALLDELQTEGAR
jgi:protein-tyrosine-phosphatase